MMAPEFAKAAGALKGQSRLVKINTEAHPKSGTKWGIRGIPTMIRFEKGHEVKRQSGAVSADVIAAWSR
jgi:thioredoxin 2